MVVNIVRPKVYLHKYLKRKLPSRLSDTMSLDDFAVTKLYYSNLKYFIFLQVCCTNFPTLVLKLNTLKYGLKTLAVPSQSWTISSFTITEEFAEDISNKFSITLKIDFASWQCPHYSFVVNKYINYKL